jgi:hypothetical protein|tara:strand:+ start:728 stop:946 length:219 start_codon:yes stop_codon:yes gene_type:complete
MTRYKHIDGVAVAFTAEEEAARDAEETQSAIDTKAAQDAATAKANNKTSGKAKLKSGDALTDAEISALFGDN